MVLVVAAHRTPRPMLEAAFEIVDPTRMIGLVFNGYDHLLAGRNMGYSGYYAARSGEADAGPRPPAIAWAVSCVAAAGPGPQEPALRGLRAVNLAIFEGIVLFLAVSGSIFAWGHLLIVDWIDAAQVRLAGGGGLPVLHRGLLLQRSLRPPGGPQLQPVRLAAPAVLRGRAHPAGRASTPLLPATQIGEGAFFSSLVVSAGLLVPLRAIGLLLHAAPRLRGSRLILGTGPLAQRLLHEIESRPNFRYAIAGVADDGAGTAEGDPDLPGAGTARAPRQDHRGGEAGPHHRRPHGAAGTDAGEPAPRVRSPRYPDRGRSLDLRVLHRQAADRVADARRSSSSRGPSASPGCSSRGGGW